jgi:ParB family transcriptional regulator, chromosome partitioning protein
MTKPKTKTASPAPEAVHIYPIRMIPLNLLDVDEANVRQIKNGVTIEILADDIAERSLIQSLNVRTANDADGNPTGRFGVKAGGRRLKALQILVKRKHIAPDEPIPCIVKDDGNATDDSLAENVFREQLHPLDQFRAFKDLAEQGTPDAAIAKRYHVTERFVQQRLKLAKASPKLLKAFQDEEISLEQLQAFCVTDDHKRQDSILKLIKGGQRYGAYDIKKTLTENSIEADDPRARFVGLETYTAAGGTLTQDLFKEESGPWLQDPVLLDQLAIAKLEAVRDDILAKGYKWAEICFIGSNIWDLKRNLATIPNLPSSLTKEEAAQEEQLCTEHDNLIDEIENSGEQPSPRIAARLEKIRAILIDLRNRPPRMSAKQIARSGVLISIDSDGDLSIEYGILKPEDVKQPKKAAFKSSSADGGEEDLETDTGETGEDEDDDDSGDFVRADNNPGANIAGKLLSDSLARDLTSYRTAALQNAIAQDFNTSFLAALHAFCLSLFYRQGQVYQSTASHKACAKIVPTMTEFRGVQGLDEFEPQKQITQRHQHWRERLPENSDALWNALNLLSNEDRGDLFSHCVSLTLDAVHGNQARSSSALHSDQLAEAVQLDMAQAGWISTAANYFGRINKEQIIQAVKEAVPPKAALIDHLKKGVMAAEAERIIKDTNWLPPLLRAPFTAPLEFETDTAAKDTAPEANKTEIPTFLKGGLNGASPPPAA